MKVSILGTNGFLSTSIGKYCVSKGYMLDMYGLNSPIQHSFDNFYSVNLLDNNLDISKIIDSDIIIYAIGAGIQSNLKDSNKLIYNLNVAAPVSICNRLKEVEYKGVFITFGSFFEVGETKERKPFTEKDILSSIFKAPNDYAISKRMLSRFVSSYSHNFIHWHFILPTIYGEKENPKRLIPYTVGAIKNGEPLHFTAGDQTRQYVYVDEIPPMIDLAFRNSLQTGVYNIEGNETLTVKELVTTIHEIFGKSITEDCFGSALRSDIGMKYLALDGKKLRDAIGFKATIDIKKIIKKY